MTFRVVVADDEERIREGMARQIESMGLPLQVSACAADGAEALALVEKYVPEIVLMDINMPFMDGLECIRRVREKDPDCAIIIVSGYDRFDYAQRALEYGVDSYLLKPVEDEAFENALRSAMGKYADRRKRTSASQAAPPRKTVRETSSLT
jgi:two-component system response regulator YesN